MERKTNGEIFQELTPEEQQKFKDTYKNHPLFDYIDWNAFYNSSDGNALDFVKCIVRYKDEDGNHMLAVNRITENGEDYLIAFMLESGLFYKVPDNFPHIE